MQEESIWKDFRREFPVAERYVYLNHAAVAPIPRRSAEAIARCAQEFCEKGIVCNRDYLQLVEEARELAARLLGVSAPEIAFVKNTTQGLLIAANGIHWEKGDNVVIPEKEFPANVYPWLSLGAMGVETRFVPLKNEKFTADDIEPFIDIRTRAVSVSAVSFWNGFRCDLRRIGQLCREKGVLFIVDGIQALGALDLCVEECYVDVLSADAHKWLLGPQGIGVLYVSKEAQEKLVVSNLGWKSMEHENDFLNYKIRLKGSAARFEEGTLNIVGIAGLKASLDMILEIGIDAIERRILDLGEQMVRGLVKKGYEIRSPMQGEERSGILCFFHRRFTAQAIFENLLKEEVVCALRDAAIRISPHFYNDERDVNSFLNALR
ncbi:MAG: aminotransferase class V-fold PLP-dependent enzyme [Candidatus Aminicenantales bacterium]